MMNKINGARESPRETYTGEGKNFFFLRDVHRMTVKKLEIYAYRDDKTGSSYARLLFISVARVFTLHLR